MSSRWTRVLEPFQCLHIRRIYSFFLSKYLHPYMHTIYGISMYVQQSRLRNWDEYSLMLFHLPVQYGTKPELRESRKRERSEYYANKYYDIW